MKNTFTQLLSIIIFSLGFTPFAFSKENFGAPISIVKSKSINIEKAIQVFEAGNSNEKQSVLITAKVVSVCEVKGCWMGLENEQGDVRVTFKNYGFFVPPTLVGKTVDIEGSLKKVTLSLEESKHYIKDAGGNPSTVTEPMTEYQIIATGVRLHKG